ncbi:MAG TPA: hypothetical protein VJP45_03285, partial [Candidatus Limnocylindria bacterium]|nr:hypothetical protein [Candidatus Limnocylindria bacterium]
MRASPRPVITRAASALALAAVVAMPFQGSRTIELADVADAPAVAVAADDRAAAPVSEVIAAPIDAELPQARAFTDDEASVSFVPPADWVRAPATALNPVTDPAEPVFEIVRYQLRLADPQLYAAPIPITSGLVADAGAVISVGLARIDSGLVGMDARIRGDRELGAVPGFSTLDDEAVYEGVHVFSRYFFSRPGDRVVVVRAAASDSDWRTLEAKIMSSVGSLRADPLGANAPAAPPPPPPPAPAV